VTAREMQRGGKDAPFGTAVIVEARERGCLAREAHVIEALVTCTRDGRDTVIRHPKVLLRDERWCQLHPFHGNSLQRRQGGRQRERDREEDGDLPAHVDVIRGPDVEAEFVVVKVLLVACKRRELRPVLEVHLLVGVLLRRETPRRRTEAETGASEKRERSARPAGQRVAHRGNGAGRGGGERACEGTNPFVGDELVDGSNDLGLKVSGEDLLRLCEAGDGEEAAEERIVEIDVLQRDAYGVAARSTLLLALEHASVVQPVVHAVCPQQKDGDRFVLLSFGIAHRKRDDSKIRDGVIKRECDRCRADEGRRNEINDGADEG